MSPPARSLESSGHCFEETGKWQALGEGAWAAKNGLESLRAVGPHSGKECRAAATRESDLEQKGRASVNTEGRGRGVLLSSTAPTSYLAGQVQRWPMQGSPPGPCSAPGVGPDDHRRAPTPE